MAGGVGGAVGVTAMEEPVVVVQAVSTADVLQPRENARRDNWGSDESEGDDVFKEFSCDATGTSVEAVHADWLLAAWLSHPVIAYMIKQDGLGKRAKSARWV
ncbi:MAG: hypothetical protein CBARDCOR_5847 [uncultured Caballeronia sp.]|nr:MAG: hypothetical protein CBARDCOR_5847 [uncultured Caballeronia sp.]